MPTTRDYDQMLKAALEMKGLAQKFIDFAKPYTSEEVPDDAGEEDMEEVDDAEEESNEEDSPAKTMGQGKGRVNALAILLKKKMKNKE